MNIYKNSEEKKSTNILITIGVAIAAIALGYLILSSYGLFNSYVSYDAKFSPWYMKVIGTIVLAAAVLYTVVVIKDNSKGNAWSGLAVIALLALALGFNVGFKFTAGDKQQQESVFYMNGSFKVDQLDKWVNENKEAYMAKKGIDLTDTAFINYVKTYSELPGINKSHSLIRDGSQAKSIAPRANEDFPLPKDLK